MTDEPDPTDLLMQINQLKDFLFMSDLRRVPLFPLGRIIASLQRLEEAAETAQFNDQQERRVTTHASVQ